MLKKLLLTLIILASLNIAGAFAVTTNISLTIGQSVAWVGGQIVSLPVVPFEKNGATFVPFRFIGEAMGARVDWDSKNKSVIFTSDTKKITLYVGNKKMLINGQVKYTNVAPEFRGYYVVVPLRMVSELLGATVDYNPLGRVITIKATQPPVAEFDVYPSSVLVGESVSYFDYSYDPDGDAIVDWQWRDRKDVFDKPGNFTVSLRVKDVNGRWSPWATRTITVTEAPNNPPQAYFTVNKTVVAQGETLEFYENSSDPDGDTIVDRQWVGRKRAFFRAGEYPISLKVKDSRGKWSDNYTLTIQVTDEVLMNEFQYNLANPVAGEIFPFINPPDFTMIKPVSRSPQNVTLFYSNSPESVTANGILYEDTIGGKVRLMYHHRNTSQTRKRFYLIARNTTDTEVVLKYLKGGYAGPSKDDFRIGQLGIMRYLESYYDREVIIPPKKWITINIGSNELVPANPNENVYGLYEVQTTQPLNFMCIALDEGKTLESSLPSLPYLKRDVHSRGTFDNADRNLTVNANHNTRFLIADGVQDKFLEGYDAVLDQLTINRGNYGVIYNIDIVTNNTLTVIVNPRGGGFGGTFGLNGNYFYAPRSGGFAFNTVNMAAMLGVINGDSRMIFTPPASSNLPISINFLPKN